MNKALTVKQPWAWAIIHGDKDIENRSRPTKHRGRLYIHTSSASGPKDLRPGQQDANVRAAWIDAGLPTKLMDVSKAGPFREWADVPDRNALPYGYVIGTVDVIGCHPAEECADAGRHCSEWAMPGHFHWVLDNARPLACPFPETGRLGLWTLGGAALAAVR